MYFLTSIFKFKLNTQVELNISFHIIIYHIILRGTDSLLGWTIFFSPAKKHADQNFVKKQKPQIKIHTSLPCNDISFFCDEKPRQNNIT